MNRAVDASAIVALLDPGDAHHLIAIAILPDLDGESRILAHPLTIAESLVHPERAGLGQRALDAMANLGILATDVDPAAPLRLARLRLSSHLRLPDCCALDVALQHNAALVTFDDTLATAGRAAGLEVVPPPG